MPIISIFLGIIIKMFWRDYNPAHFHANYGKYNAIINIKTGEIIKGFLPPKVRLLVIEWTFLHQKELMENWELCQVKKPPKKIKPLE